MQGGVLPSSIGMGRVHAGARYANRVAEFGPQANEHSVRGHGALRPTGTSKRAATLDSVHWGEGDSGFKMVLTAPLRTWGVQEVFRGF